MKNLKNSKLLLLSIFIISLAIVIFFKYLTQNCCFFGDDCFFSRYRINEKYFDCLRFNFVSGHGSGYIGYFLCKFFSFGLPALINIHPNDFLCNGASIIRGILTCLILLSITKTTIYNKSKSVFIFLYLFTACYFFSNGMNCNVICINYNFYRYFFSLLFFALFWQYIYQKITSDEKFLINKNEILKLILIMFCGYVIGTSIEITFFVSALLAGLIIIYSIFFRKNKYKLNISFYLPIGILYTAIFLFTTSSGFQSVATERGMSNINLTYDIFYEFTQLYYKVCFTEEIIYWVIFVSLAVFSFISARKNNEIKHVVFPLLMQISILTVMYSLILCGKTYTYDYKTYYFYLYHLNINFLYKMLILIPLYMYLGYVIKNFKNQKVIISAALIVIITAGIHYGIDCKNSANLFMNKMHNLKKEQYMYQKIMRYYHLKNQTAKIPEMFTKDYSGLNCSEAHQSVEIESQTKIFKDKLAKIYQYEIVPEGIDLFYADGGKFSEEELNNIKFRRLYDKNFVLNNSEKN